MIWQRCSMYFLLFAKQNQGEVWLRFRSLLKLPDMDFVKCFAPVRFPKFSILPQKKRVNCDIFGKKLFYKFLLKYKVTPVILWKKWAWIQHFSQKRSFFLLVLEWFTRAQNFLHECHLWQIPWLEASALN